MRDALVPGPRQPPGWRDHLITFFRRKNWRGFVRLYDFFKPIEGRRSLRVATRYGTQFFLTPWDSVDDHVLRDGFYESEVLEAVRPFLSANAVLWAVGANFGLHAITAKWLHPETRVIAFEPLPAMAARLLDNCELNAVEVELHAFALADRAGAQPFFVNDSGNPGQSTLHADASVRYDRRFTVATLTGAEIIDCGQAPPPTAMIVDVEGAELEVLRGLGAHLSATTLRAFVFEAPNDFLERREPADLHETVTAAGFRLRKLERREQTAHRLSNFLAQR